MVNMMKGLRGLIVDSIHNLVLKRTDLALGVVFEVGQKLVFERSISIKDYCNNNSDIINYEYFYGLCGLSHNNNDVNINKESVMDCPCGAKEDDGETRVAYDICEIWQHTRCVGISNSEDMPRLMRARDRLVT
ncbi:Zinc finger, FYVE/PHD-type [Trema orientale]|uniref:Zinc finger, FYVE/PHD-type n=1 Tax=Trema orientale TaxID=63057 RepID=A0A2P5EE10_TREOI|nr:Zinc finger, FYVE/PHD-type [Trema orientale]